MPLFDHLTARDSLRAFEDYSLVPGIHGSGAEEVHYPKLHPVQQQVWDVMGLRPYQGKPSQEGGK